MKYTVSYITETYEEHHTAVYNEASVDFDASDKRKILIAVTDLINNNANRNGTKIVISFDN